MTVVSPWTYLGHDRLVALCAQHGARDRTEAGRSRTRLSRFGRAAAEAARAAAAGVPPGRARALADRARHAAQRTAEIRRVRARPRRALDVRRGRARRESALAFAGAVMRARWAEERDIADPATLAACATEARLLGEGDRRARRRAGNRRALRRRDARRRSTREVFGTPWYVVDGEPFWGQDRLDFLARKLAQ